MKISVALCSYNGSRFLHQQLKSIAEQTRPPDELILVDDRSSDDTISVAEDFARAASFPLKIVVNDTNLGSTRNFEKAIGLCSGDVIALADQDDVWLPRKLETFESVFRSDPAVGMVFSDAALVDERLSPLGTALWTETFRPRDRMAFKRGRATNILLQYNVVTGATMAFRAGLATAVLPIPELPEFIHDAWIALISSLASTVVAIDKKLVMYRQHSAQQLGAGLARWDIPRPERYRLTLEDRRIAISRLEDFRNIINGEFLDNLRSVAPDPARVPSSAGFGEMLAAARRDIEEHIEHISARLALSPARHLRIPGIIDEMTTGRYGRYSRGWQSAALDLVRK